MKYLKSSLSYLLTLVLLVVLVGYIFGFLGIGNKSIEEAKSGQHYSILNQQIRILEKGEGPDVLLIHGTPGSIEDMLALMDSLAIDHHVIAYDRPGHGFSSANNIPRNLTHNLKIANAIIDKFNLDSTLVIGHSYGGIIAMKMACEGNAKVESAFILGSPLFTFKCESIYKLFKIPILRTSLSWLVSGAYAKSKINKELPTRFGSRATIATQEFIDFRSDLWRQPKVILSKSLETVNVEEDVKDMIPNYRSLKFPVRIMIGTDDVPYYISDLKAELPIAKVDASFHKGIGHFVQMEALDIVLSEVRSRTKASQSN